LVSGRCIISCNRWALYMSSQLNAPRVIRFGLFELDLSAGELRKENRKIKLQEQPSQVLALLVGRSGELVTREELQQALWPRDTFVEFDQGLNTAINKIRLALGDSADNPRFIETLPRKGYRFIAPVDRAPGEASTTQAQPSTVEGNRVSPLAVGPVKRRWNEVLAWVLVGVLSVAVVALAGVYFRVFRPASQATLKTVPLTSYPGHQMDPAFSPDAKQVAFAWDGEQGGNLHIYVKLVDAGEPLRLTSSPAREHSPAWAPDGRYIAFCRDFSDHTETPCLKPRENRNHGSTRKAMLLDSGPPGVATSTVPVVAPAGTVVEISEGRTTVKTAAVPLKLTLVAPVRSVPRILTVTPTLA